MKVPSDRGKCPADRRFRGNLNHLTVDFFALPVDARGVLTLTSGEGDVTHGGTKWLTPLEALMPGGLWRLN